MIKRTKNKTQKQLEEIERQKIENARLRVLEQEIWNERPHKSEIDGTNLGNTIKSYFFHHILSKNSCQQLKFSKNNIILLTAEQHGNVESDQNRYEIINERRDELLRNLLHSSGIIVKQ